MSKLYYDDPLAAAYMAREFGVLSRIHNFGDKSWDAEGYDKFGYSSDIENIIQLWPDMYPEELAINPDSYHIFEPQDGDLIKCGNGDVGEVLVRSDGVAFFEGSRSFDCETIIQRDGKPFFMPKTERE